LAFQPTNTAALDLSLQRHENPTILITQQDQNNQFQDEAQAKKSMLKSEISEIMRLID